MQPTIVLCGGGTGGHVYPLIAVADALAQLAPHVRLLFVGTERGIETQAVPARGYELLLVRMEPMRGRGIGGGLRGAARAALSIPEAVALLRRARPDVVLSIGGYAAGSISVASKVLRVPLALMEPNAVVGLANRLAAPLVDRAYTACAEAEGHFAAKRVRRTGLAIRDGFDSRPYTYDGKSLRVLVLGGSQGARSLNDNVPEALATCGTQLRVVHQAGKGNDEAVRDRYRRLGAPFQVEVTPFIDDMPQALTRADLVVGRSGAGAVAEICAVGRPALFIPYPFASGDHQYHNAQALVGAGAARCVRNEEANPSRLAAEIDGLTQGAGTLQAMAEASRRLGHPKAARVIAQDLLALGGIAMDGAPQKTVKPVSSTSTEVH